MLLRLFYGVMTRRLSGIRGECRHTRRPSLPAVGNHVTPLLADTAQCRCRLGGARWGIDEATDFLRGTPAGRSKVARHCSAAGPIRTPVRRNTTMSITTTSPGADPVGPFAHRRLAPADGDSRRDPTAVAVDLGSRQARIWAVGHGM